MIKMRGARLFLQLVFSLSLLFGLTLRDLKERYVSSYLGIMWEFVQPVITVLLMWVVFSVGFKARPVAEVPFIEWLNEILLKEIAAKTISSSQVKIEDLRFFDEYEYRES